MWRGWAALVLILGPFAVACRTTERIEIRADGSATVNIEMDTALGDRESLVYTQPFDWPEVRATLGDQPAERRGFLRNMLAIADDDPVLDGLSLELDKDRGSLLYEADFASLTELQVAMAIDGRALALAGATITENGDGTVSITADAVGNVRSHMLRVFHNITDPFDPEAPIRAQQAPATITDSTITVELTLPGLVLSHDAHRVDGNTLRWSWSLGEPALPGIDATWDPTGVPAEAPAPALRWGYVKPFGVAILGLVVVMIYMNVVPWVRDHQSGFYDRL